MAAKASTVLDTVLDRYTIRVHEALQSRLATMPSVIMRSCYLQLTELLRLIRAGHVVRERLHPLSLSIISDTIQALTGKTAEQPNLPYHVHTIQAKLYDFVTAVEVDTGTNVA